MMCQNNENVKQHTRSVVATTLLLVVATTVAVLLGEAVSMAISAGSLVGYWDNALDDLWPALVLSASLGPAIGLGGAKRERGSCL